MLGGRERAAVGGMWRRDDDRHRHRARGALRTVAGGEGGKGDSVLVCTILHLLHRDYAPRQYADMATCPTRPE